MKVNYKVAELLNPARFPPPMVFDLSDKVASAKYIHTYTHTHTHTHTYIHIFLSDNFILVGNASFFVP